MCGRQIVGAAMASLHPEALERANGKLEKVKLQRTVEPLFSFLIGRLLRQKPSSNQQVPLLRETPLI